MRRADSDASSPARARGPAPAACPRRSPQPRAPASSSQASRPAPPGGLAAELLEAMRRLDAQVRESRKKLAIAVKASGTSLTGIFGAGPGIAPP